MILDSQCNKVYLSALMPEKCPKTYGNLTQILEKYKVDWGLLDGTKDIWCRDFMPVQVSNGCRVAYTYNPDYLRLYKKYIGKITNGASILNEMGLGYDDSIADIVLDGGNVVRCGSKVVMTAKVFEENPSVRPYNLIERLETAFEAEVIILPWDTKECFGHSDGICRYVDDDTILMTNYRQYDKKMAQRFLDCLKPHFKNVEELCFNYDKPDKYDWAHINWLQTDKVIVVPSVGNSTDIKAKERIGELMPSYKGRIELCECFDLVEGGGALNCCSWTVVE